VARSVQRRGLVLAGDRSEHDDDEVYRVSRPEHSEERCGHRLVSVVPIVSMRVEGGSRRLAACYAARPAL
jgi:hypothetical protein